MCGFDALMYAVCRSPAAPDCAPTRTAIATAAIVTTMAAACLARLMECPLLFRWRRRRRLVEARRVDGRVGANLRQLEVVAAVEPRLGDLVRQLHAVDVPVVRVVRLHRDLADRRIGVANGAREQPRLLIEVERDDDAVRGVALHDVDVLVVDR